MHKIRILYVIGQLTIGGTESQLLELVRCINHDKFKILVVCLSSRAPLANLFVEAGCDLQILNREEKGRLLIFWDLYCLLRLYQPDIVHSYAYASRAAIPISKIFSGCKNIVSVRNQPWLEIVLWDRLLIPFADYILTNSKKAAESLHFRLLKTIPCQVVYNGIDLQQFDIKAKVNFALELPLNSDIRVICVVARLHPQKDLDVLLEAFTIISKVIDDVHLWVVGDGPDKEKLERQAVQSGIGSRVVFWGKQDNIPAFLGKVDIGVLSSHVEGLPNAIIEYMAAGLPVVATDVGGNPELVLQEETGLLVPPGHPQAMADALDYLLCHPEVCRRMGKAGRKRVETHFTLERMISETQEVYESLCQTNQ